MAGDRPRRDRDRPGAGARQDAVRPPARHRRRGEGAQERQGRVRDRGARDRDLHRDRAPGEARSATTTTAKLAASIRADEEKMLARILREIPKLTDAVVRRRGRRRRLLRRHRDGRRRRGPRDGRDAKARPKRRQGQAHARQARKVPGVARAEGQVKGAVASESDLAIARYDELTAEEISAGCPSCRRSTSPRSRPTSASNDNRTTVLSADQLAARRRAVARLRRAHRRGDPRGARRRRRRPRQRCAATSARTRTAPACSTPSSASPPTRN